jgi:hypothetical protein
MQVKTSNAAPCLNPNGTNWTIACSDAQGRQYWLADATLPLINARALAAKVNAKGEINADLWLCHVPYGTDAWLLDGHEDRQIEDERFGYC